MSLTTVCRAFLAILLLMLADAARAQPTNDACANAWPVADGIKAFDTTNATTDGPSHPNCSGLVYGDDQIHNDVWFLYMANCSGTLTVTTCEQLGGASTFDTRIAVYQAGAACPVTAQDLLDCNDDDPTNACGTAGGGYHSTVQVPVAAGSTYLLRVGGFGAADFGSGLLLVSCSAAPSGLWLTFTDQTAGRLIASPTLGVMDSEEKDYAWGDVDQDGDVDLVCVRKTAFNTPGRRTNVLFMNEGTAEGHAMNGVLVDRTMLYATDATDGGQGFLDPTADRDVALLDVNGDGWLDIVTATTYGQGLTKTISHPRIYVNKGLLAGVWQGFKYEEPRTPTMPIAPNFCGIGFGDVTGDGSPDLYFVEYNNTLEDRLWVNDGLGFFTDESTLRLTPSMLESDFGVHAVIADINGDGVNDIVKDRGSTTSTPPLRVSVIYNDPSNVCLFTTTEHVYKGKLYHIAVGDLDNDTLADIVVEDDGTDRILWNQGNGGDGLADFVSQTISNQSDSFGGNIAIADLDQDGWKDVVVADVDVDCCGCTRHMRFWRNLGNPPTVTFQEESLGIPVGARTGTHDVAVFDIDGDGWLDMVIGTCTGTSVWIQQPPQEITFGFPQGLPEFVPPGATTSIPVQIDTVGSAVVSAGSPQIHVEIAGSPVVTTPLTALGGNQYQASITPPAGCSLSVVRYWFSAQEVGGTIFTDPPGAPMVGHEAVAATGLSLLFEDGFEASVAGWSVIDSNLTSGSWEQASPNGTINLGQLAAPFEDADPASGHVMAFVTGNGPPGAAAGVADVDGGPTDLLSPVFDLSGTDARITYSRWCYSSGGDVLSVWVTGDGVNWTSVEVVDGSHNSWQSSSFRVGAWITPTDTVQVRFRSQDLPNDSITEAGLDLFKVEQYVCATCQSDLGGASPGGPVLSVCGGNLASGTTADLLLQGAPPLTSAWLGVSLASIPVPAFGGTLHVTVNPLVLPFSTDGQGLFLVTGIPGGGGPFMLYVQALCMDGAQPLGLALSNAVLVQFLP